MKQRDREIINHIILYCERVESYLNKLGTSKDAFLADQMCQDACCMCIAQIGELSSRLSDEFKLSHPTLPWREIKDTRNFYIHNYGGVDLSYVWITMTMDLPELKEQCQSFLQAK